MRVLLLIHGFNALSQRLFAELETLGDEVSVEFDINDANTVDAVERFDPDLVMAPYLRRAIPEAVWSRRICLVLHPGPLGDRGPAALDWAILEGEDEWGVTVLQAVAGMDEGPVWETRNFRLPRARKSSVYRHEVTRHGIEALLSARARYLAGDGPRFPRNECPGRGWRAPMPGSVRRIDWSADGTAAALRKLDCADGSPGVVDECLGGRWRLYGGWPETRLRGAPGEFLATRDEAVCRATADGAIWITHARAVSPDAGLKLPAVRAFGSALPALPDASLPPDHRGPPTWQEIRYQEQGPVGVLSFEFYNGAMNTEQCQRLLAAYDEARRRPTRVIVLAGGRDFWSNGMHLHCIEAAESPADESWRNINALDDLAEAILTTESHLTVSALAGNAGAGGVFLALAADRVWAREGVILNPHYRNMGNLYGSEYWTYVLPRRVGADRVDGVMGHRLPMTAGAARDRGLIDRVLGVDGFRAGVREAANELAGAGFDAALAAKRRRRETDEAVRPLSEYRREELARMRLNFYGFDPAYHVARYRFVHRQPHAWTPLYLARHRRLEFRRPSVAQC